MHNSLVIQIKRLKGFISYIATRWTYVINTDKVRIHKFKPPKDTHLIERDVTRTIPYLNGMQYCYINLEYSNRKKPLHFRYAGKLVCAHSITVNGWKIQNIRKASTQHTQLQFFIIIMQLRNKRYILFSSISRDGCDI